MFIIYLYVVICALQVEIWKDRRVFGSKSKNLDDIILKNEAPPALEFSKKRLRTVKIVRRDSQSIKTVSFKYLMFPNHSAKIRPHH